MVIQVWLKFSSPWNGKVVDILRRKGYFLGGSLPRWFDEDGLLMQKVNHSVGAPIQFSYPAKSFVSLLLGVIVQSIVVA
jgi:hypothetical protein